MKITSLIILFISLSLLSCETSVKRQLPIHGLWSDKNTSDFENCYVVFSQTEDSVFVAHYLEHKKRPFFEKGKGIVKGDSLIYHVDVIKPIPEWGPDGGTHYLKLSKNNKTLEGFYITDSGYKGELKFVKR